VTGGDQPAPAPASTEAPSFGPRGRARRRARFLRKARELAYRDLGGLVFNLHRFGQRNDGLVVAKLNTLAQIDGELRTLESALEERQPVTVLREAGITACPRCAAIHSGEDRFCPNCGLPMNRHVDLPIAGAPGSSVAPAHLAPQPAAALAPAQAAPAPVAPAPVAPAPVAPATAVLATAPAPSMTAATSTHGAVSADDSPAAAEVPDARATPGAAPTPARAPSPPDAARSRPPAPAPADEQTEVLRPREPRT
jgi:hypothetical protein